MIRKLLEIKNLDMFKDYRWDVDIPEFERFNIIYGWNGSGKTTLSHLFSALETGELTAYPDLKYRIETDEGEYSQGMAYGKQIRVFNQNYISENIDVLACKTNPIFILGEENRKLSVKINADEKKLRGDPENPDDLGMLRELELHKRDLQQNGENRGGIFTNVARIISSILVGTSTRT
ncbi:MAG: hypothetical protein E4G98_02570, partial [Promethearchaeota archaeon]